MIEQITSPFEWASQHLHLLGWPALLGIAWKVRGAVDRFALKWETVDKRTESTLKLTEVVKADVQTMSSNHLSHIEKDISELNQKHDQSIEILQSINTGISVLVDRTPRN